MASNEEPIKTEPVGVPAPEASKPVEAPAAPASQEAPKGEVKAEAPKTEAPAAEATKAEAPAAEAPKTEAPKTEAPKTEAPKTEAPAAEATKAEAPKAEAPKDIAQPSELAAPTEAPASPKEEVPTPKSFTSGISLDEDVEKLHRLRRDIKLIQEGTYVDEEAEAAKAVPVVPAKPEKPLKEYDDAHAARDIQELQNIRKQLQYMFNSPCEKMQPELVISQPEVKAQECKAQDTSAESQLMRDLNLMSKQLENISVDVNAALAEKQLVRNLPQKKEKKEKTPRTAKNWATEVVKASMAPHNQWNSNQMNLKNKMAEATPAAIVLPGPPSFFPANALPGSAVPAPGGGYVVMIPAPK